MSVISLIVLLLILGFVLWMVNTKFGALNGTIKMLINFVVVVIAVLLILSAFGIWEHVRNIQVPKI